MARPADPNAKEALVAAARGARHEVRRRDLGDHRSRGRTDQAELRSLSGRALLPHRHPAGNLRIADRRHLRAPGHAHEPDEREAGSRRVGTQSSHPDSRGQHSSRAKARRPFPAEPFMKRQTLIYSGVAALSVAAALALSARAKTRTNVDVAANAPTPSPLSV